MEAVLFVTRQRLVSVDFGHTIKVARADIQFSEAVKLFGVTLDTSLSFDQHVTNVARACNLHRRSLWHLRPSLTTAINLSVLGLIIATASCMPLRSGTSTVSRRYRTRRLASRTRFLSRRAPRLCTNSCTGYRSDNGSRTSWWPLLSRRSTVGPLCIFTNSFDTIRLSEHFNLLPLHCLPTICVHRLHLSGVLLLCTSSLELSRDIHKIGEHFQYG